MATSLKEALYSGSGGGSFVATFVSGLLQTGNGTSVTVNITPPAGKRAMLYGLDGFKQYYGNFNISIKVGNNVVINSKELGKDGEILIGQAKGSGSIGISSALVAPPILGQVDETIEISISEEVTADDMIAYAYAYGE